MGISGTTGAGSAPSVGSADAQIAQLDQMADENFASQMSMARIQMKNQRNMTYTTGLQSIIKSWGDTGKSILRNAM